jgi:hypothetical protein
MFRAPLHVTGFGTKIVPRVPFVVSFRPPKMAVEHEGAMVVFGPSGGGLGFSPLGGASVEDVTADIAEYPNVPVYAVHTEDVHFPVVDRVKVFSTPEEAGWPFELQLDDATDAEEMLHVRGPLDAPLDLERAMAGTRVLGGGQVAKQNGSARWSEHVYEASGGAWRQRLYATTVASCQQLGVTFDFVVTAQSPADRADSVFALADRVVAALASQR